MYLRMEEARPGVTWTLKGRRAVAMASSVRVEPGGLGARGMGSMLISKLTIISEETSRLLGARLCTKALTDANTTPIKNVENRPRRP